MRSRLIGITILAGIAMLGCVHSVGPPQSAAAASEELSKADRRQSEIVQSGDMAALTALLHPAYTVHLPNGRIIDRRQTLALAQTGAFAHEKHRRVQEHIVIDGSTGVVMGVDHLESPPPLATRGERTRRYTNVYVQKDGRWKHLVRHFHFLP